MFSLNIIAEQNVHCQCFTNKLFHNILMGNKFAERVYQLRRESGYTQKQLAKLLNVLERSVSYWENGLRECNFDTLLQMSTLFDVTIDYLLGKSDY